MDYEKKCKDALERAKVWKENSGMPINRQGIIDNIFPELEESEDEKVKNTFIRRPYNETLFMKVRKTAEHFYGLGLKAQKGE